MRRLHCGDCSVGDRLDMISLLTDVMEWDDVVGRESSDCEEISGEGSCSWA